MPTYDLKCRACGHDFEKFTTGILKEADKVCPKCGSYSVARQYKSAPAIQRGDSCFNTRSSGFG